MLRTLLSILATLTQQVSALADIQRQLKALVSAVAANHEDTTARLNAIENQLNANTQDIAAIRTALASVDTKVDSVTSVLSQVTIEMAPALDSIKTIDIGVAQANASLAEIINSLGPLNQNYVEIIFGTPIPNSSPAPQERPTLRRETVMAFPLPENNHVSATIAFVDDAGNPVPMPAGATATWASSDDTVITAVADPSDPSGMTGLVTSPGKVGVATVQLQVAIPGDPKSPYTGVGGDVTVGAGAMSAIDINFGTPAHN